MRELRSTLDVLRSDDSAHGSGVEQLPVLIERTRSSGLPTSYVVRGVVRALPPTVDQAAYRVVQEALTNVARHAGEASAAVQVVYDASGLVVRVDDDGAGSGKPPVPGYGLVGMRERVTALGGSLRAEPRPEGGFSVLAQLPLETS